jgi:hypothetical protein
MISKMINKNMSGLPSFKKVGALTFILLAVISVSCKEEAPPALPDFCSEPAVEKKSQQNSGYALQGSVSFEADVLPILKSNTTGKVYKCTVCHGYMLKEDAITEKSARNIVKFSTDKSMPLSKEEGATSDKVQEADIAILNQWVTEKFTQTSGTPDPKSTETQPGTTDVDKPAESPATNNGTSPSSGDAKAGPPKTKC